MAGVTSPATEGIEMTVEAKLVARKALMRARFVQASEASLHLEIALGHLQLAYDSWETGKSAA